MPSADKSSYLADLVDIMKTHWPENRCVNIVCHGHSVPSGYFSTPYVDSLNAYPHLLYEALKHRFPYAVINVIVTAIGGENSVQGAARFEREVLCHRPDVLTIDYALNDRGLGLERARAAWVSMIEAALGAGVRLILCTPTADRTQAAGVPEDERRALQEHATLVRELAAAYGVGLADSLAAFEHYQRAGGELSDLMSWINHPNREGHELVARELLRWFPM